MPRLEALLREAVGARVAPAIVAEAGRSGGPAWGGAFGALTYAADAPPAGRGTLFDIASLTKAVATATIAMRLFEDGRLDVAARVSELVPGWRGPDRAGATVADLLAHSAGLPGVLPLYEQGAGRAAIERAICGAPLEFPPGSRSVYSDLGFMLLGFILADAAGGGIDGQFDRIAASFVPAAETLRFGPVSAWPGGRSDLARVAPTQVDDWRGRLLQGEVDDRNAATLGGVAGHAGLFGTVGAVGAFAREILRGRRGDRGNTLASPATIERFTRRAGVRDSSRAFGWDTMLTTSSCGTRMSPEAFGHTGFTGTSLWIDPAADIYAVLLTNRVHPKAGSAEPIRRLRREYHDAVVEALEGS